MEVSHSFEAACRAGGVGVVRTRLSHRLTSKASHREWGLLLPKRSLSYHWRY